MEVRVVAYQKIAIISPVGGPGGVQGVTADFAQVELADEEIPPITNHPARRGRAQMGHGRHEISSARMAGQNVILFAPDATAHGMNQAVTLAAARVLKKGAAHDQVTLGSPRQAHRIVHACGEDRLDVFRAPQAVVGPEHMGGACGPAGLARQVISLLREGPLAPIDFLVRTKVGPMQIVGTASQGFSVEPHGAAFRYAIVIRIREAPDLRRSRHVERAFVPEAALRKHQIIREDGAPVIDAIAVGILQPQDPVRLLPQLLRDRLIAARRFS